MMCLSSQGDGINDSDFFEQEIKERFPLSLEPFDQTQGKPDSVILTKIPSLWRGGILERFFICGLIQRRRCRSR